MTTLHEFLAIRRAVALWESRADAELGAVHGLGLAPASVLVRRSGMEDVFLHLTGRTLVD